jgi:hypothetical protein
MLPAWRTTLSVKPRFMACRAGRGATGYGEVAGQRRVLSVPGGTEEVVDVPLAILLMLLGLLIDFTQGSPFAPFIYTVF